MGVKFPKPKTGRSPEYLEYVRSLPCCICERPGPNDPHHAGQDRGVGIKADDLTAIPLCPIHHREVHDKGRISFENNHLISIWESIAKTLMGYVHEKEAA